jgi:squalene-hopene/tetraprenyl-beta-curcumene cyclase
MRKTACGPMFWEAAAALAACACAVVTGAEHPAGKRNTENLSPLRAEIRPAIERSVAWLKTQQRPDGSFADSSIVNEDGSVGSRGINPALTALVVYGIAKSPLADEMRNADLVQRALAYIRRSVKPDGGIYQDAFATTYQTAVCLCALSAWNDREDAPIIAAAQKYLKSLQATEQVGLSVSDANYGGWGYSAGAREADLSNLQFALSALKESGLTADDVVWEKALQFVVRCQNVAVDGGFIYRPGESKAGVDEKGDYRSYLSMTYAGLLSFIYCNVDRDDKRVRAAVNWLRKNYDLEENVPIGKQGLFYSYHTMAKALAAYGEKTFVDASGRTRDWLKELASTLLKKQHLKGYWVNTSSRWFENDRVLVTAYTILALSEVYAASQ